MRNIVTTHAGLTNTATNSSTTNVDPRYLAAEETQRNATAEHVRGERGIDCHAYCVGGVCKASREDETARQRQRRCESAHAIQPSGNIQSDPQRGNRNHPTGRHL